MTLNEYINAMRNNKFSADPKEQLWQAVYNGDYVKFKELIDASKNISQDISEYRFGITLLHLLVYSDGVCHYTAEEAHGRQQIAGYLLELGADLKAPAKEKAFGINIGETPWQMADRFDHLPWYYSEVIRASFVYTGEHVMPIFKKHLGIEQTPSILTQFSSVCSKNMGTLAVLATTAIVVAAVKYSRANPQAKL